MSACDCRGCTRQRGSLRSQVEASWARASKEADAAIVMNAATTAGQYLALTDGLANLAIRALPFKDGPFWGRVHQTLRDISDESPSIYGERCDAAEARVIPIRRRR